MAVSEAGELFSFVLQAIDRKIPATIMYVTFFIERNYGAKINFLVYFPFILSRMILYFEFEGRRVNAEVTWPKDGDPIEVRVTDKKITKDLPPDLYFDVRPGNKVSYIVEDPQNKRLVELQDVLSRRLQEFVTKS